MQVKREVESPVSGFREPQKMSTLLDAGGCTIQTTKGPRSFFAITVEGDVVVDDGMITYSGFDLELTTEELVQLFDEIETFMRENDIWVFPFKLADMLDRWDLDPDEFDFAKLAANFKKIDQHDMGKGRGVNKQDGDPGS